MVTLVSCCAWVPPHHRPMATAGTRARRRRRSSFFMSASLRAGGRANRFGDLQVEQFLGVVLEDLLLVGIGQPVDRFDGEAGLVEPAAGARILDRADARALGAEQA